MLLGRVKRILNIPDQEVKYRHKLLALVLLAGLIMLTAVLAPAKISEQDRQKTTVAASMVTPTDLAPVPLPFIMKIPPEPAAAPKMKLVQKEKRTIVNDLQVEKPEDQYKELEFVTFAEPPVAPEHPVAPPAPAFPLEEQLRYFNVPAPHAQQEEQVFTFNAPDPRDRRSAEILGKPRMRAAQPRTIISEDQRQVVEGLSIPEFEKFEESIAKIAQQAEGNAANMELENVMRKAFTTSPVKMKRLQGEKMPPLPATPNRKTIRTIPVEKGMTITIIQNDEQIEITVKDSR
jgi:hypothetical protein